MKSLIILYSYHHNNTEKLAKIIGKVLDAEIKTPEQINIENLYDYDLKGFGSGIYGAKVHKEILNLAKNLPEVTDKKTFIFSTIAIGTRNPLMIASGTLTRSSIPFLGDTETKN